ncbi:ArsR family transcriptional regulator [Aliinostoc sp. HNIBRCY26]|uniref:ArsR family transcriptional regulator n=1 Tax=Aliinostoc sp. HNIBRCY26 TaxID=3418997 RepID=UPI003D018F58
MSDPDFEVSSTPKTILDLTELPDEQRQLMNWIIRQHKVTLPEIVNNQNISQEVAQKHIDDFISQGLIQVINEEETVYYQPHFKSPKKSRLPQNIWDKLDT